MLANLKRLEKLFREEAELKDNGEEEVEEKKKKGGFGVGGGFSLFQFGTDRYGENPRIICLTIWAGSYRREARSGCRRVQKK